MEFTLRRAPHGRQTLLGAAGAIAIAMPWQHIDRYHLFSTLYDALTAVAGPQVCHFGRRRFAFCTKGQARVDRCVARPGCNNRTAEGAVNTEPKNANANVLKCATFTLRALCGYGCCSAASAVRCSCKARLAAAKCTWGECEAHSGAYSSRNSLWGLPLTRTKYAA